MIICLGASAFNRSLSEFLSAFYNFYSDVRLGTQDICIRDHSIRLNRSFYDYVAVPLAKISKIVSGTIHVFAWEI